jgi:hypothetical protein
MTKRTSILALAAAAAIGVTTLATSSASAFGPHGPMGFKPHGPMGVSIKPHGPMGVVIKPKFPIVTGIVIHPKPGPHISWCKWHYCGPRWAPVVVGGGVVSTGVIASTPVAARPAPSCTCLTKTYLQDGSVLFKDVCTTEAAVATPGQATPN